MSIEQKKTNFDPAIDSAIDWASFDRRGFLSFATRGIGSAAALALLAADAPLSQAGVAGEAADRPPHHPPKAKRVIHLCLCGALSHVDSFDYKPQLWKMHGRPLPSSEKPDVFFGQVGLLRKPDWEFRQRGESGLWISELFPHLARHADELTMIHSMVAETSNHTPATFQENTGFRLNGFPTAGAWISYGLGNESDELPAYVVIPDARGYPAGGAINWSNGFLPARHQGVAFRGSGDPIDDLRPARPMTADRESDTRELLKILNRRHLREHAGDDALAARVESYELAARMQLAVPRWRASSVRRPRLTSSTVSIVPSRPTSVEAAYWADDCWSGAFASSNCSPAARSDPLGSIGMGMRTCARTTAERLRASIGLSPDF